MLRSSLPVACVSEPGADRGPWRGSRAGVVEATGFLALSPSLLALGSLLFALWTLNPVATAAGSDVL